MIGLIASNPAVEYCQQPTQSSNLKQNPACTQPKPHPESRSRSKNKSYPICHLQSTAAKNQTPPTPALQSFQEATTTQQQTTHSIQTQTPHTPPITTFIPQPLLCPLPNRGNMPTSIPSSHSSTPTSPTQRTYSA